jgi:Xaa-Pro aminopeptidase
MTTLFLYDDTLRSCELRHEIGEEIPDPLGFIEHDGTRLVVVGPYEEAILAEREDVVDDIWGLHDFGYEELARNKEFPSHLIGPEIMLRVLEKLGVGSVIVPPGLMTVVADHLRAGGVEVVVDELAWLERRRRKTPWEIEGIERAPRAADTGMLIAARMLREAEPGGSGQLKFEGEVLTAELIREAMSSEILKQGARSGNIIVQSGDAWSKGHDVGHGPIAPDQTCIIDVFPRDLTTDVWTDMTRTFVPGTASDDVQRLHAHTRRALDISFEALRPGRADAYERVCDYLHEQGFPTRLHHTGEERLEEGFFHSLGHGVGLEIHERPLMGIRSDELVEGDVVAVEPGVYFKGMGGIRLEDTVLVTADGVEHFTDPYPYDLSP